MDNTLLLYSLIIFLAAIFGGILPLLRKWSDELLHMFISFGAGIFIATVFFHLLPEALADDHAEVASYFILAGFLLVFFIEKFLLSRGDSSYDHGHHVISITAFLGLSVHSLIAGLGLAVSANFKIIEELIFYSIIAHKTTAAFSLVTLFLLARQPIKRCLLYLLVFSLMTPLGAIVLGSVMRLGSGFALDAMLGLTAGTFLYVAVGELLPEVFHTKANRWRKLLLMILGILLVVVIGLFGHDH
ncbi:ZIP family metal transporter [Patescibacteria group bacterium]|nr:ZIP family metal transporter [Patescibacteria group bacterium]